MSDTTHSPHSHCSICVVVIVAEVGADRKAWTLVLGVPNGGGWHQHNIHGPHEHIHIAFIPLTFAPRFTILTVFTPLLNPPTY